MGQSQASGKSTLVAAMVERLPDDVTVLVIDPAASQAFARWPPVRTVPNPIPRGVTRFIPPMAPTGKATAESIGPIIRRAYAQGNVLLVADEVADWPWLEAIVRRGMQRGVAVWWITQYATGAPRYLLSQTGVIWSGVQTRLVDVRVLEDATGVDWSVLPSLANYRFARWAAGMRSVEV
jgi:hypothetical protein